MSDASRIPRARFLAVGSTYGAQGLGYAVVVTALPSFQSRHGIDGAVVAIILLGVVVVAALGSVLADLIAVRRNSRAAVVVGFSLQAIGMLGAALAPDILPFVVAIGAYGIGLGVMDAATNMQGVLVERQRGRPVLGRFFAVLTAGAIVGALAMTAGLTAGSGVVFALLAAAAVQVVVLAVATRHLDPARAAHTAGARGGSLPKGAIVVAGLVILAAFTVDSGASTWSSVHLTAIGTAAALAPMGYAGYQAGVLVSRLCLDPLLRRFGARGVIAGAIAAGVGGGVVVALVPVPGVAVVGFVLSGLCVGALVPVGFGIAGRIDPARSDEVVARVNLFNYGGALVGSVAVGLLLQAAGPVAAFGIPALLLLLAVPALRSPLSAASAEHRTPR